MTGDDCGGAGVPGDDRGGGDRGGRVDAPQAVERGGAARHLRASRTPPARTPATHHGDHPAQAAHPAAPPRPPAGSMVGPHRVGPGALASGTEVMHRSPVQSLLRGGDPGRSNKGSNSSRQSCRPRILRRIVRLTYARPATVVAIYVDRMNLAGLRGGSRRAARPAHPKWLVKIALFGSRCPASLAAVHLKTPRRTRCAG